MEKIIEKPQNLFCECIFSQSLIRLIYNNCFFACMDKSSTIQIKTRPNSYRFQDFSSELFAFNPREKSPNRLKWDYFKKFEDE